MNRVKRFKILIPCSMIRQSLMIPAVISGSIICYSMTYIECVACRNKSSKQIGQMSLNATMGSENDQEIIFLICVHLYGVLTT